MRATGYLKHLTESVKGYFLLVVSLLLLIPAPGAKGQTGNTDNVTQYNSAITALFNNIAALGTDEKKKLLADSLEKKVYEYASVGDIFHSKLKDAKYLGQITSPDSTLKMLTWNIVYSNGINDFFNVMALRNPDSTVTITGLKGSRGITRLESDTVYSGGNWYGALYYDVQPFINSGTQYYMLIGLDLGDMFTNSKVIEVMRIGDDGLPVFGEKLIYTPEGKKGRILFHYSGDIGMMLRFTEQRDMLVYDHLSPSESRFSDNYQYYGPDFSYDGLKLNDGIWSLVEDIDLRNN